MRFRVLVELRGIPSHAWTVQNAQKVLGDACAGLEPLHAIGARADSHSFQVVAWCIRSSIIVTPLSFLPLVPFFLLLLVLTTLMA